MNKPMKDEMKKKFHAWYAEQVCKQLQEGAPLENVKVATPTSIIKNVSTNWMMQSWQALQQRPEIAVNGFRKAGILQAINSVMED